MRASAGESLLSLARATGANALFVVGTGKNVGKTVALRAVYEACLKTGVDPALASIGRDGEAIDASDARAKPRLFLRAGTLLATARAALPRSPASEIVERSDLQTAAGALVYARVRHDAYFELVGPPTASGLREAVTVMLRHAPYAIVDGAVDRIAALAGGSEAIVVSCGASAAPTMDEAIDDVRALVARLRLPRCEPEEDTLHVDGALTPARVAELIRAGERRTIVLRDPTQMLLTGKAALHALERLRIRCERPLRVVAVTVASIGRERSFEPRRFAEGVARATGLPTFDVYAAERAA
jgi:uncharacterized NAD-dependent epimerase/dehydratase family protein